MIKAARPENIYMWSIILDISFPCNSVEEHSDVLLSIIYAKGLCYRVIMNDYEYMKIICVTCSLRNEDENNLCSCEHYLSSSENKA